MKTQTQCKLFLILSIIFLATAPLQARDDTARAHQTQWAQQDKPQPSKGDMRRVRDGMIQLLLKLFGGG